MMRNDDVKNLLKHEKDRLINIKNDYDQSLKDKDIHATLRIDIKNYMENMKSALDYMAKDMHETIIAKKRKKKNQSQKKNFPYGEDKQQFEKMTKNHLPDLKIIRPDIYSLIEDMQPHKCNNKWLYDFCKILNDNKHDCLSEQTRTEQKTYKAGLIGKDPIISGPAGSFCGDISVDGIPILFDPNTGLPIQTPETKVSITIWVSFLFQGTDVEVYPLLKIAFHKIKKLSEELYKKI